MSRLAFFAVLLAFAIQGQAQVFSRGVPASVSSPEPDGRQHGIPASVLSPTPLPPGVHPQHPVFSQRGPARRFGNPREHKRIVPIPIFYPVYGYLDPSYQVADPYVPPASDGAAAAADDRASAAEAAQSESSLREAYLQGARDALARERDDARYGKHYLDSREQERTRTPVVEDRPAPRTRHVELVAEPVKEDHSPATVFIFKDGRQLETRNFAIMGQTLYDFSGSALKKVPLADLDKAATLKENDERGTTVKLP